LFSRKQQSYPRSDDRERIRQARQVAEALFTKPQVVMPSVSEVGPTGKTARKPRALSMISPLVPALPDGSETAIALSLPASEIPRSQLSTGFPDSRFRGNDETKLHRFHRSLNP
jgi:hypothetical protein